MSKKTNHKIDDNDNDGQFFIPFHQFAIFYKLIKIGTICGILRN